MKYFNKKGFTLIELMVVVGIIGVIALIAVPNFTRFQAKAKQAHAKTELSSIYGMEKAFYTEFGVYHGNLHLVGYTPDGYPMSGTPSCPTISGTITGTARYYRVGFSPSNVSGTALDASLPPGISSIPCAGVYFYLPTVAGTFPLTNSLNNGTRFVLAADGAVAAGKVDSWEMDDNKNLNNTTVGF